MTPEYDAQTGKLRLLKYDSDGNGKVDTVSYMDGSRIVRIEIDKDEDGKVDRWEYYGPDQKEVAMASMPDWFRAIMDGESYEQHDKDALMHLWLYYFDNWFTGKDVQHDG